MRERGHTGRGDLLPCAFLDLRLHLGAIALPGRLRTGVAHGKPLTCRGQGVDPDARVRYRTRTVIHAPLRTIWNFTEAEGGVLVRTEETHTGAQVDAGVPTATKILRDGLEAGLRDLKAAAEAGTQDRRNRQTGGTLPNGPAHPRGCSVTG
ncbi:hypothetical protein GCM10010321_04180 [Streptomyces chartreusis]|nr:hypothetical protein GCM10010321_04180 [Streptomyces chartreusis]